MGHGGGGQAGPGQPARLFTNRKSPRDSPFSVSEGEMIRCLLLSAAPSVTQDPLFVSSSTFSNGRQIRRCVFSLFPPPLPVKKSCYPHFVLAKFVNEGGVCGQICVPVALTQLTQSEAVLGPLHPAGAVGHLAPDVRRAAEHHLGVFRPLAEAVLLSLAHAWNRKKKER